jgi:hypothetical protein
LSQYETNSDDVRRQFEEHGEIKTFFDLISTRGMVFVTYVSLHETFEAVNVDNTWTRISLTCAQQSGLEIDYKDQRSVGDL